MTKFLALGVSVLMAAGCSHAKEPAPGASFVLGAPGHKLDVNDVVLSANGASACVAGSYVNQDDARIYSSIMLVDLAQQKAAWTALIKPPGASANVNAIACRFQGNKLVVLANADSSSAMTNSRSSVHLYQYALTGEMLKHAALPLAAARVIGTALLEQGGKLEVIGYAKEDDEKNEYYAMFNAIVDEALAFRTRLVKAGGYSQHSAARVVAEQLLIGGEFYKKQASKTDLPGYYANSKLSPAGAYLWSVRPEHKIVTASENIATAIGEDGITYSVSQNKGATSIIAVDANGKAAAAKNYTSSLCTVESLASAGNGLFAIRRPCDRAKGKNTLVWIDPAAGTEKPIALLAHEPKFIGTAAGRWFGVGGGAEKLEFSFGSLGGQ